jgi:hypothetical protein
MFSDLKLFWPQNPHCRTGRYEKLETPFLLCYKNSFSQSNLRNENVWFWAVLNNGTMQ